MIKISNRYLFYYQECVFRIMRVTFPHNSWNLILIIIYVHHYIFIFLQRPYLSYLRFMSLYVILWILSLISWFCMLFVCILNLISWFLWIRNLISWVCMVITWLVEGFIWNYNCVKMLRNHTLMFSDLGSTLRVSS